ESITRCYSPYEWTRALRGRTRGYEIETRQGDWRAVSGPPPLSLPFVSASEAFSAAEVRLVLGPLQRRLVRARSPGVALLVEPLEPAQRLLRVGARVAVQCLDPQLVVER